MSRLIDADKFEIITLKDKSEEFAEGVQWLAEQIDNAPTVEAYTKDEVIAMFTDLKNQITDKSWNIDMYDDDLDFECCYLSDVYKGIQERIDALRGNEHEG